MNTGNKMKLHLFVIAITALMLSACGDGDGVPKVEDPHQIVIDGKKITQATFLKTYCSTNKVSSSNNETCLKVLQAARYDSTRGEMPKW